MLYVYRNFIAFISLSLDQKFTSVSQRMRMTLKKFIGSSMFIVFLIKVHTFFNWSMIEIALDECICNMTRDVGNPTMIIQLDSNSSTTETAITKMNFHKSTPHVPVDKKVKEVLPNGSLVSTSFCKTSYTLLILVSSMASQVIRRSAIRETWSKRWPGDDIALLPKWKTVFLTTALASSPEYQKLLLEQRNFSDLVIGNFVDTISTQTRKLQLAIQWAHKNCTFEYLVISGDDIFINIRNYFNFLYGGKVPQTGLFAGHVIWMGEPKREGKHRISREQYSRKYYPRHCSKDSAVVLSKDVVKAMLGKVSTSAYFVLVDVYLGQLALSIGQDILHDEDFRIENVDCNSCPTNAISYHPADSECVKMLYNCFKT